MADPTPRGRAMVALSFAAVTLALWVASKPFGWHIPYILAAIVAWMAYCAWRLARGKEEWARWGLASPFLGWWWYALFTAVAALVVLGIFLIHPAPRPTLSAIAFPLYVGWAFAQEFAVQNIVVAGLAAVGVPRMVLPWLVGTIFAAAHLPLWPLALIAGVGGAAWTWMYLRRPNLWMLSASHAIVGAMALVLLLGANPVGGFYGVPQR